MLNKKIIMTYYLVLALGLTACSSGNVNDTTTDTKPSVDNKVVEDTTTKKADDVSVDTDKPDTTVPVKDASDKDVTTDVVNDTNDMGTTETAQTRSEDISQYKDIKLTPVEIYNMFLDSKPGAKIEKMALDYDSKTYYYKVKGYDDKNEYEMKLDAVTGVIVKDKSELKDGKDREVTLAQIDRIEEMVSNALQDAGDDFESMEWEVEFDNDKPTLEIDVDRNSNDLEYTYDLETGVLLEKNQ